jgi:hypothetical protein
MNELQFSKVKNAEGFIAALDQSGGSTPKALKLYGIEDGAYSGDEEMFDLVHAALPALGKPAAEDLLSPATVLGAAIHIGRVKEVDPRFLGGVHDGVGCSFLGLRTEVHGAQAQTRDGQAGTAKMGVLHVRSPFHYIGWLLLGVLLAFPACR